MALAPDAKELSPRGPGGVTLEARTGSGPPSPRGSVVAGDVEEAGDVDEEAGEEEWSKWVESEYCAPQSIFCGGARAGALTGGSP